MTAEIGIFNKSAIALAADSAVSMGNKTYESANKLFTLSKHHPVGIMVYNSASFQRFPWETLIKQYRALLQEVSFATILEYRDNFLAYLTNPGTLASDIELAEVTAEFQMIANLCFERGKDRCEIAVKAAGTLTEDDTVRHFTEAIDEALGFARTLNFHEGFSDVDAAAIKARYTPAIEEALQHALEDTEFAVIIPRLKAVFVEWVSHSVCHVNGYAPYSGIVIAGFGDAELLPSMEWFHIEGVICGKIRWHVRESMNMDRKDATSGQIKGFAQSEMIDRFMNGIDPNLQVQMQNILRAQMSTLTASVADEVGKLPGIPVTADEVRAAFDAAGIVEKACSDFSTTCANAMFRGYRYPILHMIQYLPKDELGHLAESLVSLTALHRRVSPLQHSVGGPVDVAIISKGDGFVWFRRKHYFRPELNPHYLKNYLQT